MKLKIRSLHTGDYRQALYLFPSRRSNWDVKARFFLRVDLKFIPEVTDVVPWSCLCVWMHREVHNKPPAVGLIARPWRGALLLTEGARVSMWPGVTRMGERAPVTQHSVGQQTFSLSESEICHRSRVKQEGQLGTVTHVFITGRQTGPHARVTGHVIEHVHPHWTSGRHSSTGGFPGRTQEHVICDNLKVKERWWSKILHSGDLMECVSGVSFKNETIIV